MITKNVLLVRHGSTTATQQQRFSGLTNIPLCRDGRQQARSLAMVVRHFQPHACLCSPLDRCLQTAALIVPADHPPVVTAPELRETDFGAWEGLTYAEIAQSDPHGMSRMMCLDPDFAPGNGELIGGFLARVQCAARLITEHPARNILVVTHGGVFRSLLCYLLGLDTKKHFHTFDIGPAAVAEISTFDGGAVMRCLRPSPLGLEGDS
ncbi:MAG: hypothetical protein RLZZ282_16 [Verrucomicrobiota bacterium]